MESLFERSQAKSDRHSTGSAFVRSAFASARTAQSQSKRSSDQHRSWSTVSIAVRHCERCVAIRRRNAIWFIGDTRCRLVSRHELYQRSGHVSQLDRFDANFSNVRIDGNRYRTGRIVVQLDARRTISRWSVNVHVHAESHAFALRSRRTSRIGAQHCGSTVARRTATARLQFAVVRQLAWCTKSSAWAGGRQRFDSAGRFGQARAEQTIVAYRARAQKHHK